MKEFDNLIKILCSYFSTHNVEYCIIGGVAVLLQGRFRTTEDLDIIILHQNLKTDDFTNFCKKEHLSIEENELLEGFKQQSHISIFDFNMGVRIDLKGVYSTWDQSVVDSAESFLYDDVTIKIAKPETIIIDKLMKGTQIDLEDAFSVYLNNKQRIDISNLYDMANSQQVASELREFLHQVKALK